MAPSTTQSPKRYWSLLKNLPIIVITNIVHLLARLMEPATPDEVEPTGQDAALLENEDQSNENSTQRENGAREEDRPTGARAKVKDMIGQAGPKQGALSWTPRVHDSMKTGPADADLSDVEQIIQGNKDRALNEGSDYVDNEYNARVIGLCKEASDELEAHLNIIFIHIQVNLVEFTSRDIVEVMLEKRDKKIPHELLQKGFDRIEIELGRNEDLKKILSNIMAGLDRRLPAVLLAPAVRFRRLPGLSAGDAQELATSIRGDLHQALLESILDALTLAPLKRRIEVASVDMLAYKVYDLETKMREHSVSQAGLEMVMHSTVKKLSTARLNALTYPFQTMEQVLRLDCVNKVKWKALTHQDRGKIVKDALDAIVGDNAGSTADLWCMKDSARSAGGVKVTFKDTQTRYLTERMLSAHRNGKKAKSETYVFTSSRLVPVEFLHEKKLMDNGVKDKIADDWCDMVEGSGEEKANWITDPEHVKRCLRLRVKWKLKPRLSIWSEVQDPIHRYVWRSVNLEENHFEGYDLKDRVPCPFTRECLSTHPAWGVPRVAPPHMELRRTAKPIRQRPERTPGHNTQETELVDGAVAVAPPEHEDNSPPVASGQAPDLTLSGLLVAIPPTPVEESPAETPEPESTEPATESTAEVPEPESTAPATEKPKNKPGVGKGNKGGKPSTRSSGNK